MPAILVFVTALLLWPLAAQAQLPTVLDEADDALGAKGVKSIVITGSGQIFAVGQSAAPGAPWPRFNLKTFTRAVNYETASLRDDLIRTQGEDPPRGGGVQPVVGEQRQIFVVSGAHAWNVTGDTAIPAPIAFLEREMQLWTTPHGIIKAARANGAKITGRTFIVKVLGHYTAQAFLDENDLIERIEASIPHPVLGEMPVQISYSDYKDFGGVKFPMRIQQRAAGLLSLDLVVSDVRPNAAVDVQVPADVRQATGVYSRVSTQMVADGVWYLTGGTHHSVAIEMQDHVIVVEAPLNDERAVAVLKETRSLVLGKPVRYVVNTHHHFDHAGGLRAFAAEGVTVITHESNQAFLERALAMRARQAPDLLTRSRRTAVVEGVKDRRVLTDGARTVEIHHVAGSLHHDGLLLVYLPKEKLLVEADAYTPAAAGAAPPAVVNPFSVNLADNIARLGLSVDRLLPLHGRMVPMADLQRAIGRAQP
jgi:glyoxylase-like metal-dependent hydrolase (beta-lactamase superfamily II)